MSGLQLGVPLERGESDRREPVEPLRVFVLAACLQDTLSVPDQVQRSTCVAAPGLALGFDGVQPCEQLGRGRPAAGAGAGGDHPLDGCITVACPAGNERGVREDPRAEQRGVSLARGLEGAQQSLLGPVGVAQVEELDPSGEQIGLSECRALGLATLDLFTLPEGPEARLAVEELHRRAIKTSDGYAARDILAHPLCAALATDREAQECRALLTSCALGAGTITDELRDQLDHAVRTSDHTIRESTALQDHSCPIG